MSDRRSQRIRANFKQQPNPRSRTSVDTLPFSEQIRRIYTPVQPHSTTVDQHAQLARQLAHRKGRR